MCFSSFVDTHGQYPLATGTDLIPYMQKHVSIDDIKRANGSIIDECGFSWNGTRKCNSGVIEIFPVRFAELKEASRHASIHWPHVFVINGMTYLIEKVL